MHACSQLKLLKCKRKHFSYQITNIVVYFYICMKTKRAMKVSWTANKIYLYLEWMNNEYWQCYEISMRRYLFRFLVKWELNCLLPGTLIDNSRYNSTIIVSVNAVDMYFVLLSPQFAHNCVAWYLPTQLYPPCNLCGTVA